MAGFTQTSPLLGHYLDFIRTSEDSCLMFPCILFNSTDTYSCFCYYISSILAQQTVVTVIKIEEIQ